MCRDLMKWCSRLERHVMTNRIQITSELIFVEAVDCYCACLPVTAGRMQMMFEIGKRLNFSHNEVYRHFIYFLLASYNHEVDVLLHLANLIYILNENESCRYK